MNVLACKVYFYRYILNIILWRSRLFALADQPQMRAAPGTCKSRRNIAPINASPGLDAFPPEVGHLSPLDL